VILLTGATGEVGAAVLRRLTVDGERVRCLVRDPRRLGPERVRVQIALGDLSDPGSFRNAMRGVKTVVHLAAAIRDQPRGSIEELNAVATLRLVRAAERAGAERFVFFSALGASRHARTRFFRAKALAEDAVAESSVPSTIFAPSIVYSPDNYWMRVLERLTLLPAVPISGSGRAAYQPIWTEDVADCVRAALRGDGGDGDGRHRYELAGPETLTYDEITQVVIRSRGRRRRLLHVPLPIVKSALRVHEAVAAGASAVTWDEAELMELAMVSERGTADAQALGVEPLAMRDVLAAS
jgi:NADH dehydrogenase